VTHINEGFDFLGQNLRKYDGKLLIKPAAKNVRVFLEKVRGIIGSNKAVSQEMLIRMLNPVIRGWANYHRHIVAYRTFQNVDHALWRMLWQWARRRHDNKGSRWVAEKYWHHTRLQRWAFAVDTGERSAEGKVVWLKLAQASETKIKRHRKIKRDANPFDPAWAAYFKERVLCKYAGSGRKVSERRSSRKEEQQPVVKTGSASAGLRTA